LHQIAEDFGIPINSACVASLDRHIRPTQINLFVWTCQRVKQKLINQPISQSINQSINQLIDQSIDQKLEVLNDT